MRRDLSGRDDALEEVRRRWNDLADDWRIQVGDHGDANRRLNSDPVLWKLAGAVRGRDVLDAGCGTGYLSQMLHERGARVVGVDLSERMIELARTAAPGIDFRADSVSRLDTCADGSFDLLVSNYVLMDTQDLDEALGAFHRVLRAGGTAVVVFSHPCFPQGCAEPSPDGSALRYRWDFPYFEPRKRIEPPWDHFRSEFVWFHRPLSDYWKAFRRAGFSVADFDEPRLNPEQAKPSDAESTLENSRTRPYSVVFRLRKPNNSSIRPSG